MIERVAIAGVDLALADVFASVTIRHGRGSVDDSPLATTAALSILAVDRAFSSAFAVADTLEIDRAGAVARFRGRITDASINSDGDLSILAVARLGWISGRPVGAVDWPQEAWSARVARVFAEAGEAAALVLETGPVDPLVAARVTADDGVITLAEALEQLATDLPCAITDTPDGDVLVQALTSRQGTALHELDPLEVVYAPEWSMVDEVTNDLEVVWSGGVVAVADATSDARFENRPDKLETTLVVLADANRRAIGELDAKAMPAWEVASAELLELDTAIGIGTPAYLSDLPASAPEPVYFGMVEGWEDYIESDRGDLEWRMKLNLSAPRLSSYGLAWQDVPAPVTWASVDPAATWANPNSILYP